MSPKSRLTLSITVLTGAVAVLLSLFSLHSLASARFREIAQVAEVSASAVRAYLLERVPERATPPPGASMPEIKAAWYDAVRTDSRLSSFLLSALAASASLVEIMITDESGQALASTNPDRAGSFAPALPDLERWSSRPAYQVILDVLAPARDLSLRLPIGVAGSPEPVFTIHVVASTALVREAVVPQLRNLALLSAAALVVAGILAAALANLAARPLARVSRLIDLISEGKAAAELPAPPPDRELAALESKLSLLGEQVRGAARVDLMLERLQDAVLLFDANQRLVVASHAADRFLAAPRWELIGQPLETVFPDTTPLGALLQSSVLRVRSLRDHPLEWRADGGAAFQILVSLEILTDFPERRPLGAVVTLRDAESRRQLESQIESSHRGEAFGRLLQGVAHEIKNPLNSLYTHVQLLRMQLDSQGPEVAQELDVISREVKTLDRMVVTLLDFTKPLELHLAETDLRALAAEIADLVRPRAMEKRVNVTIEAPEEPVVIQADRALLRQAILNVVTNAVECMTQPGAVKLGLARTPGSVTLSVSDQGPGIPEDLRDKIFRLYFTTKGKRGSGIGLAMAYRIVQFHDGSLDYETAPDRGTTFHFRFSAG